MARIHVEAYGCSANIADSEILSGILKESGHTLAKSELDADASIILTCIVKTPTELKMVRRLKELTATRHPLIVAGCMPKAETWLVEQVAPRASLMGPDDILNVANILNETLRGDRVEAISGAAPDRTCLPRMRRNPVINVAPIASGCTGNCSYCIVKRARGTITSFSADALVEDARKSIEEGCREIWLTAEDTASYNWSGVRLPELVRMLSEIEGRFYLRIGMMTPSKAKPLLEDLIEAFRSEKLFKFLHIPVQSGNDTVLGRMRRQYTVEDFRGIVERFRREVPDLSLSTDIICGFPGETEDQFRDSIKLVEEVRPDVLNISRFWPRPGTEAEKLDGQLHSRETKKRSRELTSIWKEISLENSKRWLGWRGEILVDEAGPIGSMMGRNFAYKTVVLKDEAPLGVFIEVKITGLEVGYLKAERV